MSKRPIDPNKVTNELSGASAFFKQSAPRDATPAADRRSTAQPAETPSSAPDEPRTPVRPGRPAKRQMIRHPFELYLDQLEQLREAAHVERRCGGVGSMSKMVRDAIDRYLDQLPSSPD